MTPFPHVAGGADELDDAAPPDALLLTTANDDAEAPTLLDAAAAELGSSALEPDGLMDDTGMTLLELVAPVPELDVTTPDTADVTDADAVPDSDDDITALAEPAEAAVEVLPARADALADDDDGDDAREANDADAAALVDDTLAANDADVVGPVDEAPDAACGRTQRSLRQTSPSWHLESALHAQRSVPAWHSP